MIIDDIIYGKIHLTGVYEEIAKEKEFLRLKDIVQTAMSVLKYENLQNETRYEHSIGMYHLMSITLESLEEKLKQEGIFISSKEKELAKLAALLHDVGHGANSHLLEHITGISHEKRGIDIIKDEKTKIHQRIVKYYGTDFIEELVEFMECIYGNGKLQEDIELAHDNTVPLKPLLVALVSNNIDLDRIDYLMRDSYYAGLKTLTDYKELISSFECILVGNKMCISIPIEKMHLIEANILERSRNYEYIYYDDIDFIGNYSFEQLINELRKHPEEVPNDVNLAIKKFLTQPTTSLSNIEYFMITDKNVEQAIAKISKTTKSEKIRYLCNYRKNAQRDYKVLYNGRSEAYIRNLLRKIIPNFPENSNSIFSKTRKVKPYKKTKFGSTNITTKAGIEHFEDLPHRVDIKPFEKSIIAINPEILRLELGISKQEFEEKYLGIIQEIIQNQAKPTQEFELKYVIPKDGEITYGSILKLMTRKYAKQDSSTYRSKDSYYDTAGSFELLKNAVALRTRNGITYYDKQESRGYKNKRATYKTYVDSTKLPFTNRNKAEEIGDSTKIEDYQELLQEIGLSKELEQVISVSNIRKLITVLVNGNLVDISFNIAKYTCGIYESEGIIDTIEVRPRDNKIIGRNVLLEVKQTLEEAFPQLKCMLTNANIYELTMADAYQKSSVKQKRKANKITTLNEIIKDVMQKRNITKTQEDRGR